MTALPEMTFGRFIKSRREQLGYKIADVSEKSGVSWASLHQYEQDKCRPFATNLFKLASAYELTANDLEPYEIKHTKTDKTKPVAKVQNAIKSSLKEIENKMTGESQFEQKMG